MVTRIKIQVVPWQNEIRTLDVLQSSTWVFPDHIHLLFFKWLNTYIIGAGVLFRILSHRKATTRKERASFSI